MRQTVTLRLGLQATGYRRWKAGVNDAASIRSRIELDQEDEAGQWLTHFHWLVSLLLVTFRALTQLVRRQKGQPASKNQVPLS